MRIVINGVVAQIVDVEGVQIAVVGDRLIGGFPTQGMAADAIVYAIEQAHGPSLPRRAA